MFAALRGTAGGATRCATSSAPAPTVCSTRPGSRWRCGGPGCRTSTRCATAVDLPLLYLPYLFVRDHGLRVTRMVADALGEELGL